MNDGKGRTVALRVSDKEFEMYRQIAKQLHSQKYFDSKTQTYRPVIPTAEPAEILRFAVDGFLERFVNKEFHHVVVKLDPAAYSQWVDAANTLSQVETRNFFTGEPTKVLTSPSLSELAFVGTNTFLQIIDLSKMFGNVKKANKDILPR